MPDAPNPPVPDRPIANEELHQKPRTNWERPGADHRAHDRTVEGGGPLTHAADGSLEPGSGDEAPLDRPKR